MLTQSNLLSSSPEAQGIASRSILAFIDAVEQAELELHSLIVVRHGHIVAQGWWSPYAKELPHMLFSLSKSFTSTAVGMAVAEGLLSISDRVIDFFPDDLPDKIDANLAAMRVVDLLTMTTGHATDTLDRITRQVEERWIKSFLACPVEYAPGTHFLYNSGATYMLSAIVQKLTGKTLLEYLTPRLFEPLGIEGATWESCPHGINTGGWGLKIKSDDIAKFGQLYLQQGNWQGQQLISPEWVTDATTRQVPNGPSENPDWEQGYGYQFWRCRHGAYRGDGAFGQFCVVMPEQDAVLAITSGLSNMQAVLDLVWKHLLPAMQEGTLPDDADAQRALADRLNSLSLHPQRGAATSPLTASISGQTYQFKKNDAGITAICLDFGDDGTQLSIHDDLGEHQIACDYGRWQPGETRFEQAPYDPSPRRIAASGAWTAEDTYTVRLSFNETPYIAVLSFRFVDERLEFNTRYNVSFGPAEGPHLTGQRA